MSIKNWKTDIKFKFPRIHIIKGRVYDNVAEEIVRSLLKWTFFLGLWKALELIQIISEFAKGLAK